MANLQTIGTGLTLILLITSLFISAVATQVDGNSFGMEQAVNDLTIQDSEIDEIIGGFNSDFNNFSNSDGLSQIPLGATSIISGSRDIINFFSLGVFGWSIVIDLMFGFSSDLLVFKLMIKTFFNMIMIFTIVGYLGGMIRSLPFFGGR